MTSRRRRQQGSRLFALYVLASGGYAGVLASWHVQDGALEQTTISSGREP